MRFSYLLAAASLLVTVQAHAAPTFPMDHGLFDFGAQTPGAQGIGVPLSTTYATLPASGQIGVPSFCSDCRIGTGSVGVLVLWNGSAWTGVSGEAVSH